MLRDSFIRRIQCLSEDGKRYVFLTNNFTLPAKQIATIYKNRWMIELLFNQIKQNFPLRNFWGELKRNKNAGLLRINGSVADGSYKEKGSDEEVVCQYDYSDKASFNELCGVAGVHKRHLQSLEKNACSDIVIFYLKNKGVLHLNLKQNIYGL